MTDGTATTTQAGSWLSGTTWTSGSVPEAGDFVDLNHDVHIDINDSVTLFGEIDIHADVTISWNRNADTYIYYNWWDVSNGSKMHIGSPTTPIGSQYTATLHGTGAGGNIISGDPNHQDSPVFYIEGAPQIRLGYLKEDHVASLGSLVLTEPVDTVVAGSRPWTNGDLIVVQPTGNGANNNYEVELFSVQSITGGSVITLGSYTGSIVGDVTDFAHTGSAIVGNITRNVIMKSDAANREFYVQDFDLVQLNHLSLVDMHLYIHGNGDTSGTKQICRYNDVNVKDHDSSTEAVIWCEWDSWYDTEIRDSIFVATDRAVHFARMDRMMPEGHPRIDFVNVLFFGWDDSPTSWASDDAVQQADNPSGASFAGCHIAGFNDAFGLSGGAGNYMSIRDTYVYANNDYAVNLSATSTSDILSCPTFSNCTFGFNQLGSAANNSLFNIGRYGSIRFLNCKLNNDFSSSMKAASYALFKDYNQIVGDDRTYTSGGYITPDVGSTQSGSGSSLMINTTNNDSNFSFPFKFHVTTAGTKTVGCYGAKDTTGWTRHPYVFAENRVTGSITGSAVWTTADEAWAQKTVDIDAAVGDTILFWIVVPYDGNRDFRVDNFSIS